MALVAAERAYAKDTDVTMWRRVVLASGASCLLWLLILWIGEWLTVAAWPARRAGCSSREIPGIVLAAMDRG